MIILKIFSLYCLISKTTPYSFTGYSNTYPWLDAQIFVAYVAADLSRQRVPGHGDLDTYGYHSMASEGD